MSKAEMSASGQDAGASRRKVVLGAFGLAAVGAGALFAKKLWTDKDLSARLFNPMTLERFELSAVPGLAGADGAPVPGFSSADLSGRRSILNIWASWCPTCREEHELLVDLAARGLAPIYGADVKDSPEHARDFLARHGNPYRAVGTDGHAFLQRALGVRGLPATFVVAPGPKIEVSVLGPLDRNVIEERIVPALTRMG